MKRPCKSRRPEKRPQFAAMGAAAGFAVTAAFAVCNGALGIARASLWHGSIGIYYFLLTLLRGILSGAERRAGKMEAAAAESIRLRVFRATSVLVPLMNAALAVPAALMVLDRRPVQTGLIPAIASAAYTTYKISAAAVKLRRSKGTLLERELGMLRFTDASVSVLVLQNTLIIAVDGRISRHTVLLAAASGAGILLLVFGVTAAWFVRNAPRRRSAHHKRI